MADYTPKYVNPTEANRYGSKSTRITKPQSTVGAYQNVNAGEAQRYITSQNQLGGQTFNLRYGGVDYTLDQSQIGWMQDRYKKSFGSYYKNTVEDSQRLLSGAMPTAFERSYGNNQLDQQLYAMGLPSSKYLGSMMKDYSDWYGDGTNYQFDDAAKSYITDAYKKSWKYEYTTEDQARKVKGLMPLALEQSYADSYTDEQLKKSGLPPAAKLSDFTTPYEESVKSQNRIQEFYLTVGAEVFDMSATRGIKNDGKTYDSPILNSKSGIGIGVDPTAKPSDQTPTTTFVGSDAWQNAFYDMLEKPEWADVAALLPTSSAKSAEELDPSKYDTNTAYREARIKAINAENKAATSTDLAITYDDFISQYNTKLERQFRALKIVDDATANAKGESMTLGDYADAMDAQRKSETYAGITDRATARQYAESAFNADPNADPTAILRGMYDGGVDFKHITQAKNRLYSLAKDNGATKEQLDALVGAYDTLNTTNIEKQQAAAKDAANKSTSFIDAAIEYFAASRLPKNASEEMSTLASETLSRAKTQAEKLRKDALITSDVIDGYYKSAFSTVSKEDASKAFKSYIKYDGKNIDPDSLDAAKVALADMGLTNYEIGVIEESVESDEQSGVGKFLLRLLYPDSGVDNTQVNTINQGYDWEATQQYNASRSGTGASEDLRELLQIARKRVTAEGIMSNYDFDQAVRVNGQSKALDPTESARNYYLEVEAPKSGATPEQAAQVWDSWTPEFKAQYTDWFSGSYMSNPEVAKSMDEVIAYQGIGSIAPKVIAGLAGSAVGLADMAVSIVDGRSDTWDFTKEVQEFTSFVSNYGRTDQSLATQGISAASDIGAEIARMYLLNAAGGAIAGQTGLASTIQSAATSNGIRFLAKAGQFTAQSTPFILNAMGGYYNEAMQGGADIKQARQYALVMGALEGFTESWQTDAIWGKVLGKNMSASIAKSAGKTMSSGMLTKAKFINLAASFLGEATEEGASYAGSWLMSSKQGWNDQPFSVEELANQSLMGGFIGMLGGSLSLPSMNEARITAEYMSKSGKYNTEYQDILVSAMFANAMPESFKEQAIAQGYKAILPIAEYKSAVENVNQSREQLINGEKQHAQDMDAMQQAFEKRVKPSEKAERMLDLLRMDGVDPASEEFSRARESLLKYGTVAEATAKHTAAVQKANDSYEAVKRQQNRAIEKSMEKVRAHHAVLADLFADDIAAMAEKTAADTADGQNYKQFAYAMQRIDELTQQGITSGAEYEAAVEALGQSQQLRDRIFDLRTKTENNGVTTAEKMRAARAGNAEAFVKKNKPANSQSKVINATEAEAKQGATEGGAPTQNDQKPKTEEERVARSLEEYRPEIEAMVAENSNSFDEPLSFTGDEMPYVRDGLKIAKSVSTKAVDSVKEYFKSWRGMAVYDQFQSEFDGVVLQVLSDNAKYTENPDAIVRRLATAFNHVSIDYNPVDMGYKGYDGREVESIRSLIRGQSFALGYHKEGAYKRDFDESTRKNAFGSIVLKKAATKRGEVLSNIDTFYAEELTPRYPDLFPEELSAPQDMLDRMVEFMKETKRQENVRISDIDSGSIAYEIASQAADGLISDLIGSYNELRTQRGAKANDNAGKTAEIAGNVAQENGATEASQSESGNFQAEIIQDEVLGNVGNITAGAMVGKKYLSEGKTAVSQFYENTLERMDTDEHTQEVRNAMQAFDEAFTYDVVSEKESIAKAKERLARGVTPELISELRSKNTWTGVDVDVAMAIKETYKQSGIETGNMDDYANWALLIADRVGENARALQALAKYTRDFKEIAITQMQRNVKKAEGKANKKTNDDITAQTDEITKAVDDALANGVTADELEKQIRKTVKKQTAQTIRDAFIKLQDGKIDRAAFNKNLTDAIKVENGLPVITTEDATRVMELLDQADQQTDDYERRKYTSMAAKIIANTEGVTLGEKLRSFQRVQMLLNPRTMLRNVDANIVFTPIEWLKDVPATLADMIASKVTGERTTTVNVQKQAAWWQGLKRGKTEAVKDIKNGVNTGRASGKYEMANKDVWKSRFMQTLDNLVGYGLQAGDRPFYEAAYDEFMTNEKLLGHDIESDEVQQRVVGLALDRVFQGEPKLYDVVKGWRDSLDKSGVPIGTLLLPFTKTPANLADKLLDYSPAGLVKAAVQLGKSKATGEFDQKQFVDRVGRSVTGTGLMILGYTLAKAGLIHGSGDDEKERQAMKNAGVAQYSLQLGDTSVSINWAEPLGSILLMGAELAKSGASSESLNVLQGLYTGGKMLVNSFFNNTVLSNVVSLFGSGYGDVAGGVESFALGTSTQFLPSMLSAIARATDPNERDTYDPNAFLQQGKRILSYFPGLRQLLPFKYGTDGQIVASNYGDTFVGRVFNSMLNPALTDKKSDDPVNNELYRLYQGGFTDQLLPDAAKTISGVTLSASQRRELQQMLGEATYNAAQDVISSSWYRTMSDAEKADAISEAVSDAATDARAAFKANLK